MLIWNALQSIPFCAFCMSCVSVVAARLQAVSVGAVLTLTRGAAALGARCGYIYGGSVVFSVDTFSVVSISLGSSTWLRHYGFVKSLELATRLEMERWLS